MKVLCPLIGMKECQQSCVYYTHNLENSYSTHCLLRDTAAAIVDNKHLGLQLKLLSDELRFKK